MRLAEVMAAELGGEWSQYYRKPNKTGRRGNAVKRIMLLRSKDATFADFCDSPTRLPDDVAKAARVMLKRDYDHLGVNYADEAEFNAVADARGIDTDTARLLWNYYCEWAVETVAYDAAESIRTARTSIEEKRSDFP
jgi:hypothetical protein